ncbi:hypothetical protein [uncultured Williamsia sp.]|uniref:hypothetical protein n=1 Tax=uncultured Williamsia sp. TaxID=259311 RepID=UPI002638AD54|nr:hypothetical protein [uncultured Williamsia sp.]
MTEEPPRPARHPGPTRPAVIVLIVGIVVFLLAGAAIVGYSVLGRGGSGGDFDVTPVTPSTVTVTSTQTEDTASPAPSSAPSSSASTTSTPTSAPRATVAGAPNGSTPCPVIYPPYQLYRASSVGSSVTTCGFAERVRKAYADSGRPGQLPRPVVATSPETGQRIRMMCAARSDIVTCTGGDDAVVYIY